MPSEDLFNTASKEHCQPRLIFTTKFSLKSGVSGEQKIMGDNASSLTLRNELFFKAHSAGFQEARVHILYTIASRKAKATFARLTEYLLAVCDGPRQSTRPQGHGSASTLLSLKQTDQVIVAGCSQRSGVCSDRQGVQVDSRQKIRTGEICQRQSIEIRELALVGKDLPLK